MKQPSMALCLVLLAGCATTGNWPRSTSNGKAVESAILWEAKLDETWTPLAMAKVVKDKEQFEQKGNFYEVKGDLMVFGHSATYVGMLGVELYAGPNATLTGTPEDIAACISERFVAKFEKQGEMYICDYKKDIKILVGRHPNIKGASIVIGAYTGP